jgi:hypothetical protein
MRATPLLFVLAGCTPVEVRDQMVVQDVLAVYVDIDAGDVALRAGPDVRLDRRARGDVVIEQHVEAGILRIEARCTSLFPCALDLVLDVPPGVPVDVHVGQGDVHVSDLDAALTVEVDDGDLTAFDLHSPTVRAQIGWGDARVSFAAAPGDVNVGVGVGDVVLTLPDVGYALDVACLGLRRIGVGDDPDGASVRARTASGTVELRAAALLAEVGP